MICAALKFTPNDGALHLALADNLYSQRQYHEASRTGSRAKPPLTMLLSPRFARSYAQLPGSPAHTARAYVHTSRDAPRAQQGRLRHACQNPDKIRDLNTCDILVHTGAALSVLGEPGMLPLERLFRKALTAPESDRRERTPAAIAGSWPNSTPLRGGCEKADCIGPDGSRTGETVPFYGEQFDGQRTFSGSA